MDLIPAGMAGFGLAGLLIGRLTLSMNPHLYENARDPILLLLYFTIGYALVGLFLGLLLALVYRLVSGSGLPERLRGGLGAGFLAGLLLAPLVYYFLLPDVGLAPGLLSGLLFGGSPIRLVLTLAAFAAGFLALGSAGRFLLERARGLTGVGPRLLVGGLAAAFAVLLVVGTLGFRPSSAALSAPAGAAADSAGTVPPAPANATAPTLVLLCIDGADLDDMVLPMAGRGELPTFSRLMREGTWGPLATIEPTLSAVVWTTIITGKRPDQHGIRHFIVFRLPGISRAIHQFPRHTGLNFRIFPVLEKIPGCPPLQAPYTSNMRTAEALWGIAGRYQPVGAWRWLVTWPVEPVNGFNVAGGVGWLQIMGDFESRAHASLEQGFHYPRDVYAGLPAPPRLEDVTREMLEPYVGKGHDLPAGDWRLKAIAASLRDPTGHYLPKLMTKFGTRFVAASFYPVDEFCHYFTVHRDKGGIFSDAVAERYRYTDARLGEFLDAVGDSVNVVVVSDHGYNFRQNHHTDAPAGVIFGIGPAFAAGRRVDGLGVYDVAPLCLTLLGLPLAADMPGSLGGAWRTALPDSFGTGRPPLTATYETGRRRDVSPVESPVDDLIKEQLRSLGYIN